MNVVLFDDVIDGAVCELTVGITAILLRSTLTDLCELMLFMGGVTLDWFNVISV